MHTPADDEQQPEEELVSPMLDVPREEHGTERRHSGDEAESQANAVCGEMVFHPEHRHPRHLHQRAENTRFIEIAEPPQTDDETRNGRQEGDPFCP